ncbi:MAG: hypothetical protein LUG21_05195 [Clostridiales bacterium]|nr:hypothetical protein [Clostridiales bacterium]
MDKKANNKSNKNKIVASVLAVALAASMLIGGGTYAYLRGATDDVVNNFETNQVSVSLDETTGSDYNIIPGTEQDKDPKVTVNNTVDSYVYVTVKDSTDGLITYQLADGWQPLSGVANVYYREVAANADVKEFPVLLNNKVSYNADIENSDMLDESGKLKDGISLTFNASAIQKAPFNAPDAAYFQTNNIVSASSIEDINNAISSADERTAVVVEQSIETTESIGIPEGKDIVISVSDGVKIVNTKDHAVLNKGNLEIIGGTFDAQAHAKTAVYNDNGAKVVISNAELLRSKEAGASTTDNGGNSYYVVLNHGTMELNNCYVEALGNYSSLVENGYQNSPVKECYLTINSGTYTGGLNTIKNDDLGYLTINGGTFINYNQCCLQNHNVAAINGGTFVASANAVLNCGCALNTDLGVLTVSGGKFEYADNVDAIGKAYDDQYGVITVTGGTFKNDRIYMSNVIAEGYNLVQNTDGTYSVVAASE